jgi:hypothetical protein
MSLKFNADKEQISEPIEITLEGKVYKVGKITTDLIKKVTEIGKRKEEVNAPIKQLACLLGVDPKELEEIDIRKVSSVLKFITDSIVGDDLKNVQKV